MDLVQRYSAWHIGNGHDVNYWTDVWLYTPIAISIGLSQDADVPLNGRVSDFIINGNRCILKLLASKFPELIREI